MLKLINYYFFKYDVRSSYVFPTLDFVKSSLKISFIKPGLFLCFIWFTYANYMGYIKLNFFYNWEIYSQLVDSVEEKRSRPYPNPPYSWSKDTDYEVILLYYYHLLILVKIFIWLPVTHIPWAVNYVFWALVGMVKKVTLYCAGPNMVWSFLFFLVGGILLSHLPSLSTSTLSRGSFKFYYLKRSLWLVILFYIYALVLLVAYIKDFNLVYDIPIIDNLPIVTQKTSSSCPWWSLQPLWEYPIELGKRRGWDFDESKKMYAFVGDTFCTRNYFYSIYNSINVFGGIFASFYWVCLTFTYWYEVIVSTMYKFGCGQLFSILTKTSDEYCYFNSPILDFYKNSRANYNYTGNLKIWLEIDSVSWVFIILSIYLIPLCLIAHWSSVNETYNLDFLYLALLILLILAFSIRNLFIFYIIFEVILIPMYFIIGIWGSRPKRILAANHFFLYTFFASIFMLFALLYLYIVVGSLDLNALSNYSLFSSSEVYCIYFALFFAFAVKVPMFPFHLWLTEAHIEAPTSGSILLAGILLKLGTYGMFRFLIFLFPLGTLYFTPLIQTLAILSSLYCSLNALRQKDLKKIVALSSIVHMNISVIGLYTLKLESIVGSLFSSVTHGIISPALFFLVGVIYDRFKTRNILYINGCVHTMPVFSIFFFLFSVGNISFPGTCSFVGELLTLSGFVSYSINLGLLTSLSLGLSSLYSMWGFNQIVFGGIQYTSIHTDMDMREISSLLAPTFYLFIIGLFPQALVSLLVIPIQNSLFEFCIVF